MKITVAYRSKRDVLTLEPSTTVYRLKQICQQKTGLHPHRQAIKKETADPARPIRLADLSKSLADYGIEDGEVVLRDIGPQIGYRTVFVVEYLGPILMTAFCAMRPAILYGESADKLPWTESAKLGVWLFLAHFVKRELETFFVHRFSRPTMPLANLFKNSIYYWGFAFFVSYVLCHPLYTPTAPSRMYLGAAIMVASELANLAVHLQLRFMRPTEGSQKRDAPRGPLFALVSCPNYTAEVLSWVGFSIMTNIAMSYVFTLVGFAQMAQWALQKHRGYLRSDPNYRKLRRRAIVPFVL